MTTLVTGASGATGKHLVEQLLSSGQRVKIIIRASAKVPESWFSNENVVIISRNISEIDAKEMSEYIRGCDAVASCLGHHLSIRGVFGKPRKLVMNAVKLVCDACEINSSGKKIRFVLMNTAGNSNRDIDEPVPWGQKVIAGILRFMLPPHTDNEQAADYLRIKSGKNNPFVEWVVVRPDTLVNEETVTSYSLHESPVRSAIFNPGKTSRINVGHCMARLTSNDELWNKWKGKMPVIYNEISQRE